MDLPYATPNLRNGLASRSTSELAPLFFFVRASAFLPLISPTPHLHSHVHPSRVQRWSSPPPTGQDTVYQRAGQQRQPSRGLLRSRRGGAGRAGAAALLAADAAVVAGRSGPVHGESPRVVLVLCQSPFGWGNRFVWRVCGGMLRGARGGWR